MYRSLVADSQLRMWAVIPLLTDLEIGVSHLNKSPVIFDASRSEPYMAYIVSVVQVCDAGEVGICNSSVYVLFVSNRSGIVFSTRAAAITHNSQLAKVLRPVF